MDERTPESTPAAGTADAPAPGWIFAHRHFNRLLLGALAGTLGDRLYQIAAIAAVMAVFAEDPSSPIAWITLAGVLPQLVLYPLIGKLVDSFDRRRILWGTFALKLPVIWLFVPILLQAPGPFREHWWQLLPLVFVLSLFTVAFGPARASAIPDVVPVRHIGIAASLLAVTGLFSILVGSLLGMVIAEKSGAVFERATGRALPGEYGPVCVIVLAALLFAAALWLLFRLPDADKSRTPNG